MKILQIGVLATAIGVCLTSAASSYTDEDGYTAVSSSAQSVTGDIQFDDFSITFANGETLEFSDLIADNFIVDGETFRRRSIACERRATRYSKTATSYAARATSHTSRPGARGT